MKRRDIFIGLLSALIVAIFSFLASSSPDGLERVAEDRNFIEKAYNAVKAPIPDYVFPGVSNEKVAGILAGIAGTIIVFILAIGVAKLLNIRRDVASRLH